MPGGKMYIKSATDFRKILTSKDRSSSSASQKCATNPEKCHYKSWRAKRVLNYFPLIKLHTLTKIFGDARAFPGYHYTTPLTFSNILNNNHSIFKRLTNCLQALKASQATKYTSNTWIAEQLWQNGKINLTSPAYQTKMLKYNYPFYLLLHQNNNSLIHL